MATRDEWTQFFADFAQGTRLVEGKNVASMAELWGVDERTYRKYEKGVSQPGVIDFLCALDRMDTSIVRPLLNFLHPDAFSGDGGEIGQIREELIYYVNNVAADRTLRQVHHNLIGQNADNIAPQLEMISAVQQLPLLYRVMVVKFILSLYELAEDRGELVNGTSLPPDLPALKAAAAEAEEACKKMRDGYKTIASE